MLGRMGRVLVAAGLAAILALPATAAVGPGFQLPSRNIACQYFAGVLRCDVLSGLRPEPRRACMLDWTGLSVGRGSRAQAVCAGDTTADPRLQVLAYGRTWTRDGIRCTSRRTGLTCTNRKGRGFFLSRERWRLF